jgi:hypothetical protein
MIYRRKVLFWCLLASSAASLAIAATSLYGESLSQRPVMYFKSLLAVASLASAVLAQDPHLQEYTIHAEGITAKFIPYGARLTSLLVADRDGSEQDVALGYDDPAQYIIDSETNHTYFGKLRQTRG